MPEGLPSRLRGDGMPVSKVVYGQQTLIDLTADTVIPEALLKRHNKILVYQQLQTFLTCL